MDRTSPRSSPSLDYAHSSPSKEAKGPYLTNEEALGHPHQLPEAERLHRDLKARHVTMIAIGGALGIATMLVEF